MRLFAVLAVIAINIALWAAGIALVVWVGLFFARLFGANI